MTYATPTLCLLVTWQPLEILPTSRKEGRGSDGRRRRKEEGEGRKEEMKEEGEGRKEGGEGRKEKEGR